MFYFVWLVFFYIIFMYGFTGLSQYSRAGLEVFSLLIGYHHLLKIEKISLG